MSYKEQVLKLRKQGFSYKQIQKQLNCSKSTICYWCNKKEKEKIQKRKSKYQNWEKKLICNCSSFNKRTRGKTIGKYKNWLHKINSGVCDFCRKNNMKNWGYKKVLEKFGTKTKCYLTGRDIDLTKDDYNFDHIIPISKGGSGDISNLGITIPIANKSKSDMTLEEYLDLCEEVLRYHGRIK